MFKRLIAVAAVLLTVAACANPKYVTSDVTRFNTLGSVPAGTFAIVAVSPEQEQSIAFRQYGDLINQRLSALGLRQYGGNAGPGSADYVVTLDYDVSGPTADVRTRGGSNFSFGFGYSNYRSPFGYGMGYRGDPFFNDYPTIDTKQMFTRRVELNMYKGATYSAGRRERVFEGRAISTGISGQIEPVMPYMLDAVFKEFPGRNGRTETVSVEVPKEVELAGARATSRPSSRSSY